MKDETLIFEDKCYDHNFDEIQIIESHCFTQSMLKVSSTNMGDRIYPVDIYLNLEQTERLVISLTSWVKGVREDYEKTKI